MLGRNQHRRTTGEIDRDPADEGSLYDSRRSLGWMNASLWVGVVCWWWENPFFLARLLRPTIFFFMTSSRSFLLRHENKVFLPSTRGFFWLSRKVNPKLFDPISFAISSKQCSIGCTFYLSRPFGNQVSLPRNFFSTFSTYLVSRQSYIRQKKTSYMTQIYTTHSQQCAFWR